MSKPPYDGKPHRNFKASSVRASDARALRAEQEAINEVEQIVSEHFSQEGDAELIAIFNRLKLIDHKIDEYCSGKSESIPWFLHSRSERIIKPQLDAYGLIQSAKYGRTGADCVINPSALADVYQRILERQLATRFKSCLQQLPQGGEAILRKNSHYILGLRELDEGLLERRIAALRVRAAETPPSQSIASDFKVKKDGPIR